jgi:hypothetical protein
MWGISLIANNWLAYEEGLCSMQQVSIIIIIIITFSLNSQLCG